jgi:hypothetical protein
MGDDLAARPMRVRFQSCTTAPAIKKPPINQHLKSAAIVARTPSTCTQAAGAPLMCNEPPQPQRALLAHCHCAYTPVP